MYTKELAWEEIKGNLTVGLRRDGPISSSILPGGFESKAVTCIIHDCFHYPRWLLPESSRAAEGSSGWLLLLPNMATRS